MQTMHYEPESLAPAYEPGDRALREAAQYLADRRDALVLMLSAAEHETRRARDELRMPRHPHGTPAELRARIARFEGTIEWLDYRADMRGAL